MRAHVVARQDPRTDARYLFAAALFGALLSQPGHLVAYLGRYGWRGLVLESRGVHVYFPGLLGASLALLGGLALVALLIAAAPRLLDCRRRAPGVPFGQLLLVLVLVQVNVFAVQEMLELTSAGMALSTGALLGIVLWGVAGQLPLALLAAVALSLLSSRLLTALLTLGSPSSRAWTPSLRLAGNAEAAVQAEAPVLALRWQRFPSAIHRRGPPHPLR